MKTLRTKIKEAVTQAGEDRGLPRKVVDSLIKLFNTELQARLLAGSGIGSLAKDFAVFLDNKGFAITNPEKIRHEPKLSYKVAKQIFTNRTILIPFMCHIAVNVGGGNPVKYKVDSTDDVGVLLNFLKGLCKLGLVLDYERNDDMFVLNLPEEETQRKYYRSVWAEECFRYIISKVVAEFCSSRKLPYKIIQNVEIARKGEEKIFTELDLVVQIADRFYNFEVKSGTRVNIVQWALRELMLCDESGVFKNVTCTIHDNIDAKIFDPQILMTIGNVETQLEELLENDFGW